uniref:Uncharacterized protein n=1 Tax=Rhizochromulina marina TaxID=1034831 RepID=A0A7S2SQG4_9STRA|mmetsp:Transcript_4139/g.12205  ORF Transcript_4139/g.12205 Transcript_4139/m.12205 type:complete len:267 (+) Transcript_4139:148-948(+)
MLSEPSLAVPCRRRPRAALGAPLEDLHEPWSEAAQPKRSRYSTMADLSPSATLSSLVPHPTPVGLFTSPEWMMATSPTPPAMYPPLGHGGGAPGAFGAGGGTLTSPRVHARVESPEADVAEAASAAAASSLLTSRGLSASPSGAPAAAATSPSLSAATSSWFPVRDGVMAHRRSWHEALSEHVGGDDDPAAAPPASKRLRAVRFASANGSSTSSRSSLTSRDVRRGVRLSEAAAHPSPDTRHSLRNPYIPPSKRTCRPPSGRQSLS